MLAGLQPEVPSARAAPTLPAGPQDAFLGEFGGSKASDANAKLLEKHPLPAGQRRSAYNALLHVPEVGPSQAHALAVEHGSLGQLMACLLDPSQCAPCLRPQLLALEDAEHSGLQVLFAAQPAVTGVLRALHTAAFLQNVSWWRPELCSALPHDCHCT